MPASDGSATFRSLVAVLDQLATLIGETGDRFYLADTGTASNVAGHVRHNLDHIEALLNGMSRGVVNYGNRQRGTAVETDRGAALDKIEQLRPRIGTCQQMPMDQPLVVCDTIDGDGTTAATDSTVGREFMFVFSHTVHHNAMIGAMAQQLGVSVPPFFGYAPSTIAHLRSDACAR